MKKNIAKIVSKSGNVLAPLALALAMITVNSACFFFTYQPDIPKSLDKYRIG